MVKETEYQSNNDFLNGRYVVILNGDTEYEEGYEGNSAFTRDVFEGYLVGLEESFIDRFNRCNTLAESYAFIKDLIDDEEIEIEIDMNALYKAEKDKYLQDVGMFLTKAEAQGYIDKYGYNHNKPRTYCMTAVRNFRYERVLEIIKGNEWE